MILCSKNQGWSFSSFSSKAKVFESDHELDLKGFSYWAIPGKIETGVEDMEFPGVSNKCYVEFQGVN